MNFERYNTFAGEHIRVSFSSNQDYVRLTKLLKECNYKEFLSIGAQQYKTVAALPKTPDLNAVLILKFSDNLWYSLNNFKNAEPENKGFLLG